jgi:chorismate mutase
MTKKTDQKLKRLRKKIDQADMAILKAFSSRFDAVGKVGKLKNKLNLPVLQKERWKELLGDRVKRAKRLGISEGFIKTVFNATHLEAIRIQKNQKKKRRK